MWARESHTPSKTRFADGGSSPSSLCAPGVCIGCLRNKRSHSDFSRFVLCSRPIAAVCLSQPTSSRAARCACSARHGVRRPRCSRCPAWRLERIGAAPKVSTPPASGRLPVAAASLPVARARRPEIAADTAHTSSPAGARDGTCAERAVAAVRASADRAESPNAIQGHQATLICFLLPWRAPRLRSRPAAVASRQVREELRPDRTGWPE